MTAKAMIRPRFRRPAEWTRMEDDVLRQARAEFSRRLIMGLTDMQNSILETPVYTGGTLVNFQWSIGSPKEGTRAAVKDPPLPGKTSDLPLGSEPRRRANAAVVQNEFEAMLVSVRQNPFQDIFLVNNKPNFSDIEYGTYARDGKEDRTPPMGMTRRGETLFEYDMMGYVKRVP